MLFLFIFTEISAHANTIESQRKDYLAAKKAFELKQYKKSKFGSHLPIALAKTLKVLFPNRLHKCYLKNAPMVFRCVFRLIYPLLDKDTRKKIFFIKGDKEIPCTEYSLDNE